MFNFKKESVFERNTNFDNFSESKGGVLAVWGTPSSGKTTVATKLAHLLASKKKNVILLLCDATAPMLPCITPSSNLEIEKSLGSILSVPVINENIIKYNMITHKRNPYLSIIGMLKNENEYSYAPYTQNQVEDFIDGMRNIAPYIIIDCSSYIVSDILSSIALKKADYVLRLASCDLKSISYLSSQLSILQNSGFNLENHYKVASNIKANHGIEKMVGSLGSLAFKIEHSQEVEQQFLEGDLLQDLQMKNSKSFKKEISKIIKEVFEC